MLDAAVDRIQATTDAADADMMEALALELVSLRELIEAIRLSVSVLLEQQHNAQRENGRLRDRLVELRDLGRRAA